MSFLGLTGFAIVYWLPSGIHISIKSKFIFQASHCLEGWRTRLLFLYRPALILLTKKLNRKPQAAITQTRSGCNCSIWLVQVVLVLEALCCFSRAHSDIDLHSNNMSLVKLAPCLFLSSLFSTHSLLDICGRHRSNAALCTCSKHINIPRILVYTPSALQHTSSMSNMISEVPTPLVVTSVPGPASTGGWLSNCACLCVCAGFCKA